MVTKVGPCMDYLDKSIKYILEKFEGGGKIVNNPNDPGGLTKWGISSHAYPDVDIEKLTLSKALKIIKNDYAKPIMFYEVCMINPRLAFYFLDFSIHSGSRQATKILQEIVNSPSDGFMGPNTLASIGKSNNTNLPQKYLSKRMSFLSRTSVFSSFREGFINRILNISNADIDKI